MRRMVSSLLAVMGLAVVAVAPGQSRAASLETLVSFCALPDCADGVAPNALIVDANGNLFSTASLGGTGGGVGWGTVFEIAKTAGGYASTATVLVNFCSLANCADGVNPRAMIADTKGNLFGTVALGYPSVRALQDAIMEFCEPDEAAEHDRKRERDQSEQLD